MKTASWIFGIMVFAGTTTLFCQPVEVPDSLYVPNQMMIWFRAGALNTEYLGCGGYGGGDLPFSTDFLLSTEIFNILSGLHVKSMAKVVPFSNPCGDTVSLARAGDTIPIPDFYNLILVTFEDDSPPMNIPYLCWMMSAYQNSVKICEPNFRLQFFGNAEPAVPLVFSPNDTCFATLHQQRSLDSYGTWDGTDVVTAWDRTRGSSAISIGICDGGVQGAGPGVTFPCHPDLGGQGEVLLGGWNYALGDSGYYRTGTRISGTYLEHGTAMAGVIAALSNNGRYVAGICGGSGSGSDDHVKLISLAVSGQPSSGSSELTAAIIEGATKSGLSPIKGAWGCDALVMANGPWGTFPEILRCAFAYAYANDVPVFINNTNQPISHNPAVNPQYPVDIDDPWAILIGGYFNHAIHQNSGWGPFQDFLAPWENATLWADYSQGLSKPIFSASGLSGYPRFGGCSSATPHAAGIGGLLLSYRHQLQGMWSVPPYLAPEDIVGLFAEGVSHERIPAIAYYPREKDTTWGYGYVNAENALSLIFDPYELKHIEIAPESVTIVDSQLIQKLAIGFPCKHREPDTLYDAMQYKVRMTDLAWTHPFGNGDYYAGIVRAWARGRMCKGFPDVRTVSYSTPSGIASTVLPLYRSANWAVITRFMEDRCDIETYIYRTTKHPMDTASVWSWLDGIGPSGVRFAISVLHDTRITDVPSVARNPGHLLIESLYPNAVGSAASSSIDVSILNPREELSISVFDILGRKEQVQYQASRTGNAWHVRIATEQLARGCHFFVATTDTETACKAFVIVR